MRYKHIQPIFIVALLSLTLTMVLVESNPASETDNYNKTIPERVYPSEIYNVVDGDTVDARFKIFEGIILEKRIRLSGIDAPEVRGDEKPQGLKSTEWLKEKLNQHEIYLMTDGFTDKYGRMLGSLVYYEGETLINLNKLMVEEGFAENYE